MSRSAKYFLSSRSISWDLKGWRDFYLVHQFGGVNGKVCQNSIFQIISMCFFLKLSFIVFPLQKPLTLQKNCVYARLTKQKYNLRYHETRNYVGAIPLRESQIKINSRVFRENLLKIDFFTFKTSLVHKDECQFLSNPIIHRFPLRNH